MTNLTVASARPRVTIYVALISGLNLIRMIGWSFSNWMRHNMNGTGILEYSGDRWDNEIPRAVSQNGASRLKSPTDHGQHSNGHNKQEATGFRPENPGDRYCLGVVHPRVGIRGHMGHLVIGI